MINGAHTIIFSTDADADRDFLRDVLGLPHVDVGHGWLIFGLPPAEVAVHPADTNGKHELYLMCDDVEALVDSMRARSIATGPIRDQGWGLVTEITLPSGGKLPIYQPRHARPRSAQPARKKKAAKKTAAKTPKKKAAKAPAKKKAANKTARR
jgi:catechol 2,3-dioxygenase-like lactoylglutathione lyase family enzyme